MNRFTQVIGIKGTLLALSLISTVVMADEPTAAPSTTPEASTPTMPSATPDAAAPVTTSPTATMPSTTTPDATTPAAPMPGTTTPATTTPTTTTPGTDAPATTAPATTAPTTTPAAPGDKSATAAPTSPMQEILPEQFKVYYNQNLGIARKAFNTSAEKIIPTNNEFTEAAGCYLSCYSKNAKDAIYPVDTHVYLMGQIRVQGHYHNGLCLPKGFENQDIRAAKEFKAKCEEAFPERCEKESCWASGNTGNWF